MTEDQELLELLKYIKQPVKESADMVAKRIYYSTTFVKPKKVKVLSNSEMCKDAEFLSYCDKNNIVPTPRQASKWRRTVNR